MMVQGDPFGTFLPCRHSCSSHMHDAAQVLELRHQLGVLTCIAQRTAIAFQFQALQVCELQHSLDKHLWHLVVWPRR